MAESSRKLVSGQKASGERSGTMSPRQKPSFRRLVGHSLISLGRLHQERSARVKTSRLLSIETGQVRTETCAPVAAMRQLHEKTKFGQPTWLLTEASTRMVTS